MTFINRKRTSERGNIFFTLFGAVAIVGVLGAAIMATMRGPLTTMVEVNRRAQAEAQMSIASKMVLLEAVTTLTNGGDCDSDGFVEPLEFKDAGSEPAPTGGGLLPDNVGVEKQDPWGTYYGYCVWDAGPVDHDAANCGGASAKRLAGKANSDEDYTMIAIISAGPDHTFQTTCTDGPPALTKGGDDIVSSFDYSTATSASGGLWTLKNGVADTATINKKIEVGEAATFNGGINMTASSAALQLGAASLVLPTTADTPPPVCNGGNNLILRINMTTVPVSLDICDNTNGGWKPVSAGSSIGPWQVISASRINFGTSSDSFQVGINNADPQEALDIKGNAQLTGDVKLAATKGLVWASGASTTESGGSVLLNANGGVGVELTVAPSAVSVVGNTTITGTTHDNTTSALIVKDSTAAPMMVVRNDGHVGIGDNAPGNMLSVSGNIDTAVSYKIDDMVVLKSDATTMSGTILVGNDAGADVTGDLNTIVGAGAAATLIDGEGNIVIGNGVDVFATNTDNSLNIANLIQGDLGGHRVGIGFANPVDVGTFDDALEVNGSIDAVTNVHADSNVTAGADVTAANDITATNDIHAGSQIFVHGDQLGPAAECDPDEKLQWTNGAGWSCVTDLNDGSGGAGPQDLEAVLTEGNDANGLNAINLGGVAIGSGTLSNGSQQLELDVTGDAGADHYCDSSGNNCFQAIDVGAAATPKLSSIIAADGAHSIDNVNFAQTWNWNTLTTQTAMTMASNSMTTGSVLALTDSFNDATSTGSVLNITASGVTNAAVPLMITNAGTGMSFRVNDDGTTTDATPFIINAAGNVGIGDPTPDDGTGGGGQVLKVDIEGAAGASYYCDKDGLNCFQASDVSAAAAPKLSAIIAADAAHSIDSLNFGQTWDWSTISTQTAMALTNSGTTLTSGKLLNVASAATAFTGTLLNVALSGDNGANTGTIIKSTVSGATSAAVPMMVTNLGTGTSFRVNDETGDADATPFVIDAAGQVGIGDATPDNGDVQLKLDVEGPVGATEYCDENGENCFSYLDVGASIAIDDLTDAITDYANENMFLGQGSGAAIDHGTGNTALGIDTLTDTDDGLHNTALGATALTAVTDGDGNVGIGYGAGANITSGSNNIMIGDGAAAVSATGDDQLNIGNTIWGNLSTKSIGIGDFSADTIESALHIQSGDIRLDGGAGSTAGCLRFDEGAGKIQFSNDCSTFHDMAASGTAVEISNLSAATQINTINNLNFAQTWNWNTLTTETALALGSTTMTTGTVLNVASTNAGATTGAVLNVANATTGGGYGVKSIVSGAGNTGSAVYGSNSSATGANFGVYGTTASTNNAAGGVVGTVTGGSGNGAGVSGQTTTTGAGSGVAGTISGAANSGTGIYGNNSGAGNTGNAGYFTNSGGGAVANYGVIGTTNATGAAIGVSGRATGAGNTGAAGSFINSGGGAAVNAGVTGTTDSTGPAYGVAGSVTGAANTGYGLYGLNASATGWALWAEGATNLNGSVGIGDFSADTIDSALHIQTGDIRLDGGAAGAAGCLRYSEGAGKMQFSNDCSTFTDMVGAGGAPKISDLDVADKTNSIDNLNFAQTWDWSTLSTQNALSLTASGTTQTSGKVLNVTSASTGLTGSVANFDLTGSHANNTGNTLRTSITGVLSTGTPLMVTNLGVGPSMRVNDQTGDNDGTPFIIAADGSVGIQNPSPTGRLVVGIPSVTATLGVSVAGPVFSDTTASDTVFSGNAASNGANFIGTGGFWGIRSGTHGEYHLDVYNSSAVFAAMTVLQTGNIGIHTTSPLAGLDVQHAITAAGAVAYGGRYKQTLTAAADSDVLNALYIDPTFADAGHATVAHNGLIVADGNVGIGDTSPDNGDVQLMLDVNGPIGGTEYCDETGHNCFDYTDIIAGATAPELSDLLAASQTNSIDNLNFNQAWDWSTISTQTAMALTNSGTTLSTGKLLNITSASTAMTSGTMLNVALTGDDATNTGTLIKSSVTGTSSAAVPLMVTNLGTGLSFRVNDQTGDADASPFIIDETGKVGIGLTTAATALDIGGVTTFRGNVIAGTDNTYDIGASGATRPRTGYFGTSVVSPLFTNGAALSITTTAGNGAVNITPNGTGPVIVTSGATTGTGATAGLEVVGNSLTSGNGVEVSSTSTGLTGSLASFALSGSHANNTGNVIRTAISGAASTGTPLMVTNNGVGFSMRVNDDGTDTDASPFVIDAAGQVGIGDATPDNGDVQLKLDVEGPVGATTYCDETGHNCFDYSDIVAGTVASKLSDLFAADQSNSIDNLNFAQVWDWSTIDTQTALKLSASGTTLTSGKILNVTSASTGLTGSMVDLALTGSNAGNTGNVLKTAITGAASTGTPLMVTNNGVGASLRVNDDGTDTDATPFIITKDGYVGIGDASPDNGDVQLMLDVEGPVGATTYCDETGHNCFDYTDVVAGAAANAISDLVDATGTNTLANANFAQVWNWDTLTTETALTLASTSMTSGSVLNIASTNAGATAGIVLDVANATTGAGYGIKSTVSGANNTGYGVYASNTSATGWALYANGRAYVDNGSLIVKPPATQTIATGDVIAANACGTIKPIDSSTGNVITDTTNTFTSSTAAYAGCCMDVLNVDAADTITLDDNAKFKTGGAANVALAPNESVRVCSNGTNWYQVKDKVLSAAPVVAIDDLTDAVYDTTVDHNMRLGSNTPMFSGAQQNLFIGESSGAAGTSIGVTNNVGVGFQTLTALTTGGNNVAIGTSALTSNDSGAGNIAIGSTALTANEAGASNIALGSASLSSNIIGDANVAIGDSSLLNLDGGDHNISIGSGSGVDVTSGSNNIMIGDSVTVPDGSDQLNIGNTIWGDLAGKSIGIGDFSADAIDSTLHIQSGDIRLDGGAGGAAGCLRFSQGAGKMQFSHDCITYVDMGAASVMAIDDLTDAETDYTVDHNMFMGSGAGASIAVGGQQNLFIGENAGAATTTGDFNTGVGYQALKANTGGSNTAIGTNALTANIGGQYNAAMGTNALAANTSGNSNIAIGRRALYVNADGDENIALGTLSLSSNISGDDNTAIGEEALANNTASWNTAIGSSALNANVTGIYSTAIGANALRIATGNHNSAFGFDAGDNITTGSDNIIIGYAIDAPSATDNGQLDIGDTIYGLLASDKVGISVAVPVAGLDVQTAITAAATVAYGGRYKQTLTAAADSDVLNALYIDPTFADGGHATVAHNGLIVADGNVGIGDTSPDNGDVQLMLDVNGPIGGTEYCDENGENCFTYLDIVAGATAPELSDLTDATQTNSIDSLNFNQTWDWSTISTQTAMALTNSGTTLSTGKLLNITSATTAMTSGTMLNVALTGDDATNTGTLIKSSVTGTSSAAVPLMVTNLGTGLSFRVNDQTGDADASPFIIDETGKVGIGLTTAATALDIGGVTTFRGNVIAGTDNTYDIGASGATRPRTGYFGTSVVSPLFTNGAALSITTTAGNGAVNITPNGTGSVIVTSGVTSGAGATAGMQIVGNALTSGNGLDVSSSSLTTGSLVKLTSTSADANANTQKVLNVATSGANANNTQTTYGGYFSNTHTGTASTNVALYATASLGSNNFAAQFSGNVVTAPPATQTIGNGDVIVADACGTIKPIDAGGNVTTDVTNTFTSSTASLAGCCMDVVNVDAANTITLDDNAKFKTGGGADVALTPGQSVRVCSNGTNWYQSQDKVTAAAPTISISDLTLAGQIHSIDNTNYAQTWDWSTISTQTALALTNSGTTLSTGKLLNITSASTAMTSGTMLNVALTGDDVTNAGTVVKASVTGTSSAAVPLMVTNLGAGNSFRVNDQTGDADASPFIIDAAGNVGIGLTTAATALDIGGVTTFRGNVIAGTDNTYDIGASGATRPRTAYLGTSVVSPLFTNGAALSITTTAGNGAVNITPNGTGPVVVTSGATTGTGATAGMELLANSLTTGNGLDLLSNSLTSGNMLNIGVTGSAALTNQTGLKISNSGATTTNAQTTYGAYITNTRTNATSGTNIGLYASASGASTGNFAAQFSGNVVALAPAAEDIAGGAVITANACGSVKQIMKGTVGANDGSVTTDTTNTFTSSTASLAGCCMDVVNVETGTDVITLDDNAKFKTGGSADIALGAGETIRVCSNGTNWYQVKDKIAGAATVTLDTVAAATGDQAGADHGAHTVVWNWSTLGTGTTALTLANTNAAASTATTLAVNSATTGAGFGVKATVSGAANTGYALYGANTGAGNSIGYGVYGTNNATGAASTGAGVYGAMTAAGNVGYGGYFTNASTTAASVGVAGYATGAANIINYGVYGSNAATGAASTGAAVYGTMTAAGNVGYGGYFTNASTTAASVGVAGYATGAANILNYGVYGSNAATGAASTGAAVYGTMTAAGNVGYGGYFTNASTTAAAMGVKGIMTGGGAVVNTGVQGTTNATGAAYGVYGSETGASNTGYGVYGLNNSTTGYGVYGTNSSGYAVYSNGTMGVSTKLNYGLTAGAAAPVTAAAATVTLDTIAAATGNQAGIANAAYTVVWNWATLATGTTALTLANTNAASSTATTLAVNSALTGAGFGIKTTMSGASGASIGVSSSNASVTANSAAIKGTSSNNTATTTYGVWGENTGSSNVGAGVYGTNVTTGVNYGVRGDNASVTGGASAVYGNQTGSTGATFGVQGVNVSTTAASAGVYGKSTNATNTATYGVWGENTGSSNVGAGVYGKNVTTGVNFGVRGDNASVTAGAAGVYGKSTNNTGTVTYGVFGENSGSSNIGYGVYGSNASNSSGTAVYGVMTDGGNSGFAGYFDNQGTANANTGVYAKSNSGSVGEGVHGEETRGSNVGYGGRFVNSGASSATVNWGVSGTTNTTGAGYGVYGSITGASNTGYGVYGLNASTSGYAVYSAGTLGVSTKINMGLVAGNAPTDGIGWTKSGTAVSLGTSTDSVGIGSAPSYKLHVADSQATNYVALFNNTNTGTGADGIAIQINVAAGTAAAGDDFISFQTATGTQIGHVQGNGSAVLYTTTSDRRLKDNIRDTHFGIEDLMKVHVRDYNYIVEPGRDRTGFVAQELYDVYPYAVAKPTDETKDHWSVDYGQVTPLLAKSIQDVYRLTTQVKTETDKLKEQVATLKAENDNMKTAMNDMSKDIDGLKARTNYGVGKAEFGPGILIGMGVMGGAAMLFFFLGGALRNRRHPLK